MNMVEYNFYKIFNRSALHDIPSSLHSVTVADIKAVVTGKDCPHMREKGALKNKVRSINYCNKKLDKLVNSPGRIRCCGSKLRADQIYQVLNSKLVKITVEHKQACQLLNTISN